MKNLIITTAVVLSESVWGRWEMDNIAFAYLQNRHGARAPEQKDETSLIEEIRKFRVGQGMLTPQGMRQRYLNGRKNRERYIEEH